MTEQVALNLDGNFAEQAARYASAATAAAAGLDRFGAAAQAADKALAQANAGQSIGERAMGLNRRSTTAVNPEIYRAIGAYKKEQDAAKRATAAATSKAGGATAGAAAMGVVAGAKMYVGGALAKVGISSAMGLAELAMGIRGMAQMQMLSARAQMQTRLLFRGVDSSPAVRAYDHLLRSVDTTSVAGNAMAGAFSRTFNSLFGFLEQAQPYATAFVQGMVLGALYVENAWLQARLALLPVTDAIGSAIGPINGVNAAAGAGLLTFSALAIAVGGVGGAFTVMAGAIAAVVTQWQALKREWGAWEEGRRLISKKLRADLGFDAPAAPGKGESGEGMTSAEASAFNAQRRAAMGSEGGSRVGSMGGPAPSATPTGAATGQALAQGVAAGMTAGAGAVEVAAGGLVKVADSAMRKAGDIHSPSGLTKRTGRELPAGTVAGIESGAGDVQAAAERALVPRVRDGSWAAPAVSTAGASAGGGVHELLIRVVHEGVPAADRAKVDDMLTDAIRSVAMTLGVRVALSP